MCLPPPPHRAALNRAQVDRLVLLPAMVLGGHFGNGAKEWEAGAARPREEEILGFHSGLQSNPPPQQPHHPGYQPGYLPKPCLVHLSASAIDELQNFTRGSCCCHQDTLWSWHPAGHAVTGQQRALPPGRDIFQQTLGWQESGCG